MKASTKPGSNDNRKGSGVAQFGRSFQSTLGKVINGHRNPTYQWLKKLLEVADQLGLHATKEYAAISQVVQQWFFYDPVVRIELSEAEVMDIEVEDPNHCYVANGLLSHNTLQAVAALCYIWERDPDVKVMVVCPKSAIGQWESEIDRFTTGVKCFQATGSIEKRKAAYVAWYKHTGSSVLIMNYHAVVRDWDQGITKEPPPPGSKPGTTTIAGRGFLDALTNRIPKLTVILDEIQAVKNPGTKTHQTCKFLADRAKRVWGLTATLLQNHLIEGFGIYKVIRPQTFGTKNSFLNIYCITEMQRVKGGGRIPIIVGYRNLDHFRQTIDPFFYGRQKHLVSNELPSLTTREVICELSATEDRKYAEALSGIFKLGTGEIKDYQETKQLTSLIYIQEVCNSLSLLKYDSEAYDESVPTRFERVIGKEKEKDSEGRSAKETALASLLTEEFDGEKVVVYTRFASHIDRLKGILAKEGIHSVVISGAVNKTSDRKAAQDRFQDPKSKVGVIFITDAGSESINLQMASAMIFFDTPWSWGRYVQILGRIIRIGSPHQKVLAIHLLAKRPGLGGGKKAETIDHKVIQKLRKKKGLIDQVIGEAAVGALKFERDEDSIKDLVRSLIDSSRV